MLRKEQDQSMSPARIKDSDVNNETDLTKSHSKSLATVSYTLMSIY